jgi:DNA (cytosine-5)-methyltransferase 1
MCIRDRNFPSHKVNSTSISNLECKDIPKFDLFLGGFPCQSFSIAGNRKGFDDERGNLFFDIIRILSYHKPKAILLENVKNLQNHDNSNTFMVIKTELEKIGYFIQSKVLNTCKYANIPQNRERIFIVGFLDRNSFEKFKFPEEEKLKTNIIDLIDEKVDDTFYYSENSKIYSKLDLEITKKIKENQLYQYRRHLVRENKSKVCPTLTANMGSGGHNVPLLRDLYGIRKLTPRECFRFQGFPNSFKFPNISNCHLYKQAGNSVTVPLITKLAIEIKKVL